MTRYVTEIYDPHPEPAELQVMHKYPMAEPETEAAQLGGSGPRPNQHPERNQSMSTPTTDRPRRERAAGPRLPTTAELYRATEATQAVLSDPAATAQDRYRAAEREEATARAFNQRHGSQSRADLERWREMEAGA
jgi:hypothetical protein